MNNGYEGKETVLEGALIERGITIEQHQVKMKNLERLARSGLRVIKAVEHNKYKIQGAAGAYNPYTNKWDEG